MHGYVPGPFVTAWLREALAVASLSSPYAGACAAMVSRLARCPRLVALSTQVWRLAVSFRTGDAFFTRLRIGRECHTSPWGQETSKFSLIAVQGRHKGCYRLFYAKRSVLKSGPECRTRSYWWSLELPDSFPSSKSQEEVAEGVASAEAQSWVCCPQLLVSVRCR